MKLKGLFVVIGIFLCMSCSDDSGSEAEANPTFEDGFFIVNEGNQAGQKASIFFDDYQGNLDYLNVDIYELANEEPVEGAIRDLVIEGAYAYLLIDSPEKENNHIEILDKTNFELLRKVEDGVGKGEKLLIEGDRAYVLSYSPNNGQNEYVIQVIDLEADSLITSVPTGCYFQEFNPFGEPYFIKNNQKIYTHSLVANLIVEMDLETNSISHTYPTTTRPTSMVFANNELYYSGLNDAVQGAYTGLYKINVNTGNITTFLEIDYRLIKNLSYSNGMFSLMFFESPHLHDYGTIYSWNGNDAILFDPIEEAGGYSFAKNMTTYHLRNNKLYFTYDDSRHILDLSSQSFVRHSIAGPNTSKIVFE